VPLAELTRGFPADPTRAKVAYAESALFVAYLRQAAGPGGLPALIARMSRGESVDDAILAVTGQGLAAHEAAWRGGWEGSPLWLKPLFSEDAFFAFGAVGFVVGGAAALRRRRQRHAAVRADDGVHDALTAAVAEWPGRPSIRPGRATARAAPCGCGAAGPTRCRARPERAGAVRTGGRADRTASLRRSACASRFWAAGARSATTASTTRTTR
jgi:hypothetical protein